MAVSTGVQVLWSIFVFLVVFNFLPAGIAWLSRHPERRQISLLNLLSLFSFALWLALFVWAVGGRRDDSAINRFMADPRGMRLVTFSAAAVAAFSFGGTLGGLNLV